jgi:membrane-associated protease RseP (regulator of RpoE activity)
MRKELVTMSVFLGLVGAVLISDAADKNQSKMLPTATTVTKTADKMQAYLGVGAEPMPEALTSQLPSLRGPGCGVLVAEVAVGSPAEKAGIKQNDILIGYDDQRLYAPEQFVKLVRYDKPDRQIKLGVIHDGKSEEIKVALGERAATATEQQYPMALTRPMPMMHAGQPATVADEAARWESFDSLTLSRTDKDHFKAEIKYRNEQGKLETRDFQGTREQIRKDIEAQKDLPTNERQQLLRATSLSSNPWEEAFPFVEFIPGNGVLRDFIESAHQYH